MAHIPLGRLVIKPHREGSITKYKLESFQKNILSFKEPSLHKRNPLFALLTKEIKYHFEGTYW